MAAHFLYEGETEKKLFEILGAEGRKVKFNAWSNDVRKLLRLIRANDTIYIVYDTDAIDNNSLERFKENIKALRKISKKIILIQQNKNMEDELVSACKGITLKELCIAFNASFGSKSDFKSKFIKSNSCLDILIRLNFDKNLLFNKQIIRQLNQFSELLGKPKYTE